MKHSFSIGQLIASGKKLSVDIPRLVDTRMLVQANSGGGKSWLLRLIAERAAGNVQVIILDPEGEFATLREKIDIALVGHGGEIAADLRAAELLARKLAETRISAIIDLYDLKLPDRRRFIRLFLESLMNVPRAIWHPILVILDEAHIFAPEKNAGEAESTNAVIALMSQGRKRGFAGILSTQRLSKLHKDAAAEANNVLIGRTWLDVDQQRAGDLLGMNKEKRSTLRDLSQGEFYAFGPALNANGVVLFVSDQVTTSHPKAGERHLMDVPPASEKIQEIVKQIGDLPAQAEAGIRDLESAKKRIIELEREMRQRPIEIKSQVETRIERVEIPIFKNGDIGVMNEIVLGMKQLSERLVESSNKMRLEMNAAIQAAQRAQRAGSIVPISAPSINPVKLGRKAIDTVSTPAEISRPQQAILDALATFESLGIEKSERGNAAVFAGQSPRSSGYANNLGRLKSLDLINYPSSGFLELTDLGRKSAKPMAELVRLQDLHDSWFSKLSRPQAEILRQLIQKYPDLLDKTTLAELSNQSPTSSGYANNLGRLKSLGIIVYPRAGMVAASELLFPSQLA